MNWKNSAIIVCIFTVLAGSIWLGIRFTKTNTPSTDNSVRRMDITTVSEANNQFALDYYSQVRGTGDDNIIFSPFSMSSALAMTYEGARGTTADEMRSVLYLPADTATRRLSYASLMNDLTAASTKYQLNVANALWIQNDYHLLTDYTGAIKQYYQGSATNLDFKNKAEGSRKTINSWVEDHTNNKIKDLIAAGQITDITRLVLTNAVYFKGSWSSPFDESATTDQDFRTSHNGSVKTPMMATTGTFDYMANSSLQMIRMPYDGDRLSMVVLLPKQVTLNNLEETMTAIKITDWQQQLTAQKVEVSFPKFKFEKEYDMSENLQAMGMPTAFAAQSADFTGLTGNHDLYIGAVGHKALVEVNEKGTEAAAATFVIMSLGASIEQEKPKEFRADHPFIFLIEDDTTGTILFMGRVAHPAV